MGLRDHYIAPKPTFREVVLTEVLREANARGGFTATVVATWGGLPVASVPAQFDSQTTSAMAALVTGALERARSQLGMAAMDEFTAMDARASRLVCRYFDVLGEPLILAAVVPPGREYRRVMDEAIRRIIDVWQNAPVSLLSQIGVPQPVA